MFIGRHKELEILEKRIASDSFEFGLIYGRRRIGKTELLKEIVKKHKAIYYAANEMGIDNNLAQLNKLIAEYYGQPYSFDNYSDLLKFIAKQGENEPVILIIDEFTYMISSEPGIMSVFQNAVDQYFLNSKVKLLLSGSQIGLMEEMVAYKKPLYGRTTFKMKIEPFDYYDASGFYENMSSEDKVRLYAIFGGVPFYASKIDSSKSVKENIVNLIVASGSDFESEVEFFLSQEVRSISTYGKILNAISAGATRISQITSMSNQTNSGNVAKYLEILSALGIAEKEICFGESNNSKKTIYRIKDQLFRFHYTFMEKHKSQRIIMKPESFYDKYIEPHLDEYVSLEYEKICRDFLIRKYSDTISQIGRYWYNNAKTKTDIEIDIAMVNKDELSVYECKWTNKAVHINIMSNLVSKSQILIPSAYGIFAKNIEKAYTSNLTESFIFHNLEDLYFKS